MPTADKKYSLIREPRKRIIYIDDSNIEYFIKKANVILINDPNKCKRELKRPLGFTDSKFLIKNNAINAKN